MLITRYSGMIESADGEFIICGFTWGRLWGNYTDPNYGAEFAVIVMILSLFFLRIPAPALYYTLTWPDILLPAAYGTGYSTVVNYAKEHTPDTYLINNPLGEYISRYPEKVHSTKLPIEFV